MGVVVGGGVGGGGGGVEGVQLQLFCLGVVRGGFRALEWSISEVGRYGQDRTGS